PGRIRTKIDDLFGRFRTNPDNPDKQIRTSPGCLNPDGFGRIRTASFRLRNKVIRQFNDSGMQYANLAFSYQSILGLIESVARDAVTDRCFAPVIKRYWHRVTIFA